MQNYYYFFLKLSWVLLIVDNNYYHNSVQQKKKKQYCSCLMINVNVIIIIGQKKNDNQKEEIKWQIQDEMKNCSYTWMRNIYHTSNKCLVQFVININLNLRLMIFSANWYCKLNILTNGYLKKKNYWIFISLLIAFISEKKISLGKLVWLIQHIHELVRICQLFLQGQSNWYIWIGLLNNLKVISNFLS